MGAPGDGEQRRQRLEPGLLAPTLVARHDRTTQRQLRGTKAGQFGTGVRGETLARIRDLMIDQQYRDESVKNAYYATKEAAFGRMEDIVNEPSETGLAKSLDLFWASLQDLSVNPDDAGARSVVRQRAMTLSETFNYMSSSLQKCRPTWPQRAMSSSRK